MDNRPIGVFDSGVGGLTVVKQVIKVLPKENIVYFGDTARVPYGSKSKKTVTRFSRQIVRFLQTKNVKAIIIACNTASSNSLAALQEEFDIPLFGVVIPGVTEALATTKNKKIGVIGTSATIGSGAYENLIQQANTEVSVYSKACPLFVPLVEEGWMENQIARMTAKAYLQEMIDLGVDSLVLGCTHYPLLKRCIGETVGEEIRLVDPAKATARGLKTFLEKNNLLSNQIEEGRRDFYVSDATEKFGFICQKALKKAYEPAYVDIEEY